MKKPFILISTILISLFLTGCVFTVPAKVYNLDTGDVFHGSFKWDGSGYGPITGITDKGYECSGEYLTIVGGESGTAWGRIYAWGDGGFIGSARSTSSYVTLPNTQQGSAIMSCPDKNIIQCEYVVNTQSNHGSGYCTDNQESRYKFTF